MMKKREKIQRNTILSLCKRNKRKRRKMGKVFGSEIRFYLKFRFRDNERKTGNDFDTEGNISTEASFDQVIPIFAIDFRGIS